MTDEQITEIMRSHLSMKRAFANRGAACLVAFASGSVATGFLYAGLLGVSIAVSVLGLAGFLFFCLALDRLPEPSKLEAELRKLREG